MRSRKQEVISLVLSAPASSRPNQRRGRVRGGVSTRCRAGLAALVFHVFSAPVGAEIAFEEKTSQAGVSYSGPSYGASWGDVNGDGLPDLWLSNHQAPASLFVNLGDGRFRRASELVVPNPARDTHGAAWGDFDGDGDQDLIQVVGGANPNLLYVNEGGVLVDRAAELGAGLPGTRSRSASWIDVDLDGMLDLVLLSELGGGAINGSAVLLNRGDSFALANEAAGFTGATANYAVISDLDSNSIPDLIVEHLIAPRAIYQLRMPLLDLTPSIAYDPQQGSGTDSVVADLDNDGVPELFLTRAINGNGAELVSSREIWSSMTMASGERGLSLQAVGRVTFEIHQTLSASPSIIRIGSDARAPTGMTFMLDPADPTVAGMPVFEAGRDLGVFIGYDLETGRWELRFSSGVPAELRLVVRAETQIDHFETLGFAALPPPPWPTLYRLEGGRFVESRVAARLNLGLPCYSVVAGDFDNDMDLDLYLACTGPVRNRPNVLLENVGNGRFQTVAGAGGAAGTAVGRADVVVTADYDGDGFLDLLVTNGLGGAPFNHGPTQLFRNRGNDNHWLAIDVRGPRGRRASVHGAKVVLEAGGVRQVREVTGGYHRVAQNHSRLHFGLGPHAVVERLEITWPTGERKVHRNVAADRVLSIAPDGSCGLGGELAILAIAAAWRSRHRRRG
jgi:hypothetical protein